MRFFVFLELPRLFGNEFHGLKARQRGCAPWIATICKRAYRNVAELIFDENLPRVMVDSKWRKELSFVNDRHTTKRMLMSFGWIGFNPLHIRPASRSAGFRAPCRCLRSAGPSVFLKQLKSIA